MYISTAKDIFRHLTKVGDDDDNTENWSCVCGHPAEFYGLKIQPFCYFCSSRTVAGCCHFAQVFSSLAEKQHFDQYFFSSSCLVNHLMLATAELIECKWDNPSRSSWARTHVIWKGVKNERWKVKDDVFFQIWWEGSTLSLSLTKPPIFDDDRPQQ